MGSYVAMCVCVCPYDWTVTQKINGQAASTHLINVICYLALAAMGTYAADDYFWMARSVLALQHSISYSPVMTFAELEDSKYFPMGSVLNKEFVANVVIFCDLGLGPHCHCHPMTAALYCLPLLSGEKIEEQC